MCFKEPRVRALICVTIGRIAKRRYYGDIPPLVNISTRLTKPPSHLLCQSKQQQQQPLQPSLLKDWLYHFPIGFGQRITSNIIFFVPFLKIRDHNSASIL